MFKVDVQEQTGGLHENMMHLFTNTETQQIQTVLNAEHDIYTTLHNFKGKHCIFGTGNIHTFTSMIIVGNFIFKK